jgi:hypothetical protein
VSAFFRSFLKRLPVKSLCSKVINEPSFDSRRVGRRLMGRGLYVFNVGFVFRH